MDWLTFKFCVFIWVLCVSKSKSQSQLVNSTSSLNNQLRSACEDGQPIVPPDQCNNCICFAGQIYCTNIPCPEQDCVNGVDLPQPDACNKCICRRGKVTCSNMICIPAPHCAEKQLYPAQNKCNACMCMKGFITCTSNPCAEEPLPSTIPTTTTKKPKKKKKCIEGESLPGHNECIECFCQNGGKRCKYICKPTLESRFGQEPECVPGQHIPRPDDCNNCICFEGQIHCTHLPCRMDTRIGPECSDDQPVFRPDECNECYCFEGRLECSDLVCIRGSKCVQGQVIPKPDICNACKCVEGHILCTDYQCPIPNSSNVLRPGMSSTEVRGLDECQEGDIISPPPPPNDCNTCFCMDNRIICTMNTCEGSAPEIKGRLSEPNEQTDLEIFDKQISVEPFIHMLSKNYEKLPAKLIHTHAYNGFHQEIKVHANHIPKDATKLLKVLATSLDNAALASISQTLLASSNSLSNNHDSKIPLDHQVVQTNSLGEGNVLTTQSSKLITSGSQSNETILVLPNTEPFDGQNSQSVLPLTNKQETIWKSVSSPGSLVFNNNQEINPYSSQEEKLNVYHYDSPPSMFMPIDQNNVIRNPSKFSRPGHQHMLPTKHARNTVHIPNTNPQSIYPASNFKSTNINDGKMSYAPFSQEIKQFKPIPSGFVSKHDKWPHLRPYQQNLPGHNQVFNYTSSPLIFRPGKIIGTPNNNNGQQKRFLPNFSKYYQVKTQLIPFKPNQNHLPTLNNKGIQYPPLFLNNLNQPIVAVKHPRLGIKPGQGSVSPLINIGNQTDQQFMAFLPNFQINSPLINLPNQKKRISNEGSKETPPHSMVPSSTAHHTNILNPPQIGVDPEHTQHKPSHSQFVPNPSIYYKNEYEAPKINEVNPDLTYKHTEQYNPPHTSSEFRDDTHIAKVRNKTRKYNTTHSHYEKHTTITYVSEHDPTDPAIPLQIVHDPNQHQNAPQTYAYEHYLPDQESQELDLTMSKVNYYLNLPNLQLDQNEPQPKLTHYYPSQTTIFAESAEGPRLLFNSAEDPTHQKSNEYLPPPSPTGPTQNQHPPEVFDDRESTNGFQYAHNAYEDSRQLKPVYKLPPSKLETPQNHQLPEFFGERESADGFQYPSNSAEDLTHPKVKLNKSPHFHPYTSITNPEQPKDSLHISPHSQFGLAQNQHKPGLFDNRGVKDGFQYAHNADKNPTHLKPVHKLLPITPLGPTLIQHSPGIFDERASADGFQYPSNFAENPIHSRGNLHNPKLTQFGPTRNQHLPGRFDERGSADGFQYPSNSAENPLHPKENIHKQPNSPFGSTTHNQLSGMFDEHGSADGFQYPSNSADKPLHPKNNLQKLPQSQFIPSPNQHAPGVFDDRGSANGFQYPSNSAENPLHPKENIHKQPNSPFGSTTHNQLPGMFDERGSADGFQYPSNSADKRLHPKQNIHKPPNSPLRPTTYKQLPGIYPHNSADNPTHPKNLTHPEQNKQKQQHSQVGPNHNKPTPGMFDGRESPDGFQYSSNSSKNPLHPKDILHYPPHSQFGPPQNQHSPGVFHNRGSPGVSNSAENPIHPKNNPHKLPQSQFLPSPNQHTPGVFDDRGSANGFQYPSNSAGNPTHPKQNTNIQPNSPFDPAQNQHLPGMFDERGSADGFQYPSNSAENPTHPKQNNQIQPKSPVDPAQNQHLPGMFDERGSANGFQYPSNSAENPTHPKNTLHKLPQSQFLPSPNQHTPGVFNDRGSADRFQYPSNSVENPTHPKNNLQKLPQSQFIPSPNQHAPGVFDDRGSANGFQYPSNSAENPTHPKQNTNIQPNSPFDPALNQYLPGMFDERGSADGFQYPSNSAENPTHPKQNNQIQPNSPIDPNKNQHIPGMFDERGSANGFQYPSNSAENPTHPKNTLHKLPQSQFLPSPNQHTPGVFDDRGSADRFQYPSNSVENPTHPKNNLQKLPQSQFIPSPNQHAPGVFDDRGSANGFQYPSNSAENPSHPKQNTNIQPKSPFDPAQYLHLPGMFDERGSTDGFQYPSNSAENPTHPKDNLHKLSQSQFLPSPNQHTPGVFDDRESAGGFHYPSNSAEDSTHQKGRPPHSPLGATQNQHLPGIFDERGSADGLQYPSNFAENPTLTNNNPNTNPQSKFKRPQNQPKPSSSDDVYYSNNPLRPWMHLDHDQYKTSSFDNLLNGVHNIPWSSSGDQNKDSDTVTFSPKPKFTPDYDQYKPSSFDNLFNGIHQIPWAVPNQDNNALGSDAESTTPRSGFKPKQDQYGPSMVIDPSISNQNENIDPTDVDDNQLQIEQDVSTPSTDLADSVSTQYNVLPKLKPDSNSDCLLPTDDGKIPDYYEQLYPLIKAVKKLSDPPIDDSVFSVGSMDQLDLLPYLFPGIAKILKYEPSQDQDDISPVENHDVQRNPLSKLKSNLKQLPENHNGILDWLKSKLNKLVPRKDNATVTKKDIDLTKIFNLLSKLTPPNLKDTAALQNIPFNGFDPEIIEHIMNDFKEDTLNTTSTPRPDSTRTYEKRFKAAPTISEESRPQAHQLKYPDVHIILHQPNDEDDVDILQYTETDGKINIATDIDSEELSASMFPKMFNPRFRHRPKDQKEECGDGTQWISNCHSCSCYFGQAMCVRLPDCELRPLGEPMTCKPYSHFKMGCYTCECNGDGVAECDATDCNTQPSGKSRGSTESPLPIFHEFFDSKETNKILQYYNYYKKLPKDCPKKDLQTQYPTCERGTSWVSSCHKCECSQNGKHECNKIDDCKLDVDKYGKPGRCKPNSKFYPKTNSMPCVECSCNDEGISYCPAADYKKH